MLLLSSNQECQRLFSGLGTVLEQYLVQFPKRQKKATVLVIVIVRILPQVLR